MRIETEFDVGYEFWVPRVQWEYHTDEIISGGRTYRSEERTLVARAKPKTLVHIEINQHLDDAQCIEYRAVTGHGAEAKMEELSGIYSPDEMRFTSQEAAQRWADEWLATNNTTYYGERGW